MQLKFRSLEARIVFDGDDLDLAKNDYSSTQSTSATSEEVDPSLIQQNPIVTSENSTNIINYFTENQSEIAYSFQQEGEGLFLLFEPISPITAPPDSPVVISENSTHSLISYIKSESNTENDPEQEENNLFANFEVIRTISLPPNSPIVISDDSNLSQAASINDQDDQTEFYQEESHIPRSLLHIGTPITHIHNNQELGGLIGMMIDRAYYIQGRFYMRDANSQLNKIRIKNSNLFSNDFFEHNNFHSSIIKSKSGPVQFYAGYQNQKLIPIRIGHNFFYYPQRYVITALEIMDTMLNQSSQIVWNTVRETKPPSIEFLIQTESIFSNHEKFNSKNINRIHYKIVTQGLYENGTQLHTLIFNFSVTEVLEENSGIHNDRSLMHVDRQNAYHGEGLFYLRDINNPYFNNLLIQTNPRPILPIEYNSIHSTTVQSSFGINELYAIYENYQNAIPIHIGIAFFFHSRNNVQVAMQVIDRMLHQSSPGILSEIEETRATSVEFFIQNETIFFHSEALSQNNISRLYYEILPRHTYENRDNNRLIFNFCLTGIRNSQAIL